MNLIARQTIKGSVYSYLGALLGFLNVALLMPSLFSTAEIGLTNILVATSSVFGQLGTLGFMNVTVKLFPHFRDKLKKHNGFVFLMLAVGTFGFLLCTIFYYIFKDEIILRNINKSPLFAEYIYLLLPFIFITIFHYLIDVYNRVLFNASFGIFVKEFALRILNLLGILLFYFNIFDFNDFIIYYTCAYAVPVLLMIFLLIYRGEFSLKPSFKLLTPKFCREMLSVAFFGLITGFGGIATLQIDKILVNNYYNLDSTGVYSVMFFFGTMILIPGRSLVRISASVIAEAFKHNDFKKVGNVYKKSVNSLTFVGVITFLLIWGNVENILQVLRPEYIQGKYVIFFVALAHLFQMVAGTSAEIINYGKFYREYSVITIILILSVIGFNVLLLPVLGITGASIALAISYLIFLLIRFVFVKIKYGYQPYDIKFWLIIVIGTVAYFISLLIPQFNNFIVDIMIRSSVIFLIYIIPVYILKLSEDCNDFVQNMLSKIRKHKKS
ncbi:MAG: polysaccharide biosynthesis C-terminal domain-containing protein [Bacteroidales bacterium]|jgi:O-antigen/teichoic acid export membrane protein|nr:polysaccharide biosynthesis C-terminal domain-containing protein [Bacteroidales bacterium]